MTVVVDRGVYAELSTTGLPPHEVFDYWQDLICATFVRLTAEPVGDRQFHGRIEYVPCGDLELTTVAAGGSIVRRTPALIARENEEYLLASVQLTGRTRVEQDGRTAHLTAGTIAFYDSTRPYTLHSGVPGSQLVAQVPKREVTIRDTRKVTARPLGSGTPGAVVAAFLTSLYDTAKDAGNPMTVFGPHAIGLLSAAASFAEGRDPDPAAAETLLRQRMSDFLRRNFADPRLDVNAVARACRVSRRTLYRLAGEGGVAAQLRRVRIEHAKGLLRLHPGRPVGAVAAACGFDSESGFRRAFHQATGRSPGEYRGSGG
ncbi:helix-turn-helix domain-containing protein [Amycolatopsis jejuensis]|uniref:AraC-like ligand-binding domain-containing protein n=1 Tax=Amycolatopsis jejuensis TaxID=330084 RepID=UPI0005272FC9|nr:helix-turn-helix domain-containing protein [Amycolatopsis jejuensis]